MRGSFVWASARYRIGSGRSPAFAAWASRRRAHVLLQEEHPCTYTTRRAHEHFTHRLRGLGAKVRSLQLGDTEAQGTLSIRMLIERDSIWGVHCESAYCITSRLDVHALMGCEEEGGHKGTSASPQGDTSKSSMIQFQHDSPPVRR